MGAPQEVESATSEYQQESDILGQFLEECTFEEAGSVTSGTALWMEYKQWAEANGERLVTSRVFKAAIQEKGFERVRRNTGYHYRNITLHRMSNKSVEKCTVYPRCTILGYCIRGCF